MGRFSSSGTSRLVPASQLAQFPLFVSQDREHVSLAIKDSEGVRFIEGRELFGEGKGRNPLGLTIRSGPSVVFGGELITKAIPVGRIRMFGIHMNRRHHEPRLNNQGPTNQLAALLPGHYTRK